MYKRYRIRLYPNAEQAQIIDQTIGNCRFIYNKMLAERIEVYEKLKDDKTALYAYEYKTEKEYKSEFEFLKLGSSKALAQTKNNLKQAYQNFFKSLSGKRRGRKINAPKFKKKMKSKWSYREPQSNLHQIKPSVRIDKNFIALLKLGKVKFRGLNPNFHGEIKSVTVIKNRDNTYTASILVSQEITCKKRSADKITGLDIGLKTFAVTSDGNFFQGLKNEISMIEKKIRNLQKHFARKPCPSKGKPSSRRREKLRVQIAKLHIYKTNLQNHFFYILANKICNESQVIVVENLNIEGMLKNRKLSHAIHLSGWGRFFKILREKAIEYQTEILEAGRFFPSSKTCSSCGQLKSDLVLDDRIFDCDCGNEIDRDLNAALNLQKIGKRNLVLQDGFSDLKKSGSGEFSENTCGEIVRPSESRLCFDLAGRFLRGEDLAKICL